MKMSDLAVKRRDGSEMTQKVSQVLPGVAQQVTQLSDVITCLRTELNKDLPIQHIALILAVVQQPGISMQDLMDSLGMPQGSVSRNVKLLSSPGRGYGLLRNEQDLVNRKQVLVFPTEKCIDLVEKLCRLMQVEIAEDVNRCSCKAVAN
jgi:DNA-binding MarR family transcriptional regulator